MRKTDGKPKLWINEEWVQVRNDGKRYRDGESGVYETWASDPGALFRSLLGENGRCTGSVYVNGPKGEAIKIGWCFEKRRKYDDCKETYLAETWITLHDAPPTKTTQYHCHVM